ncbi:MAG: hypothetical protein HY999_05425, partial [Nitrospinae bacterium]|nr:hypothetical protein [Nitrospinota bacterium]
MVVAGVSTIKDKDYAQARKKAIDNGVIEAVENIIFDIVDFEALTPDNQLINTIYKKGWDYVQKYKIISESVDLDLKTYKVVLQVTILSGDLKSYLTSSGLLLGLGEEYRHTVAVIINERDDNKIKNPLADLGEGRSISESIMIQRFQEKGLDVMDRHILERSIDRNLMMEAISGDMEAAISIGIQAGVEVIIIGNAVINREVEDINKERESFTANISARAIRIDKGTILCAKSEFATILSKDEIEGSYQALREASERLSSFLIDKILDYDNKS